MALALPYRLFEVAYNYFLFVVKEGDVPIRSSREIPVCTQRHTDTATDMSASDESLVSVSQSHKQSGESPRLELIGFSAMNQDSFRKLMATPRVGQKREEFEK